MVGEAVGRGRPQQVRTVCRAALRWAALLGMGFSLAFVLFGRLVLGALTWHAEVVEYATAFLPWQWAAPLLSVAAYFMDGVFVGATRPREMRDATFLAMAAFLAVGHGLGRSNNWLWAAFLLHVIIRAAALLCWYPRVEAAASQRAASRPLLASAP
uniref:Protein RFT1 homolog n=1 Tax=Alexandrium catenella TaxID=2925 RepID=A0A7S1PJB0_ALECA